MTQYPTHLPSEQSPLTSIPEVDSSMDGFVDKCVDPQGLLRTLFIQLMGIDWHGHGIGLRIDDKVLSDKNRLTCNMVCIKRNCVACICLGSSLWTQQKQEYLKT